MSIVDTIESMGNEVVLSHCSTSTHFRNVRPVMSMHVSPWKLLHGTSLGSFCCKRQMPIECNAISPVAVWAKMPINKQGWMKMALCRDGVPNRIATRGCMPFCARVKRFC